MVRPTVARVDLHALQSNYRRIVEHVSREGRDRVPRLIAVVKANAYGHGAGQVGRALEEAGADLLACADIEEGALSCNLMHLANISYRLGRTLNWDEKTWTVKNDPEANQMLTRDYRAPYVVPANV